MDFPAYTNITIFFFTFIQLNTRKKDTNVDRIREQDGKSSEKKLTAFESNIHLSWEMRTCAIFAWKIPGPKEEG